LAGKTVSCPTCKQPLQVPLLGSRAAPAPAAAPPDDGFWDALLPKEPQKAVEAAPASPVEESVTGHKATALAIGLLSQGVSPHQARAQLIERGVSRTETDRVLDTLAATSKSKSQATGVGSGLKNMLIGGTVCFIGLAVTVGSYIAAEPGGVFLLAWGPIIFGALQFFRGLFQLAIGSE
jgi:hypothetical protein